MSQYFFTLKFALINIIIIYVPYADLLLCITYILVECTSSVPKPVILLFITLDIVRANAIIAAVLCNICPPAPTSCSARC